MAAEGISHDCQHSIGEVVFFARTDAANERLRDDRRRDVEIDGFEDGPSSFTRVRNVCLEPIEIRISCQSLGSEIEQPTADDATISPDLRNLFQFEMELFLLLENRKSLGIGL